MNVSQQRPEAVPAEAHEEIPGERCEDRGVNGWRKLLPGHNFSPPIYVDGTEVFTLSNGKRCSVRVPPGKHSVTSDDKCSMIEIDAKTAQRFLISAQEIPGGFLKGPGKLTMVANEWGRPEYKIEKPLEDERKIAKGVIEDDAGSDQPAAK